MRSVPRCSLADVIWPPVFIFERDRISASRYSVPFFSWMLPTRARGPGFTRTTISIWCVSSCGTVSAETSA